VGGEERNRAVDAVMSNPRSTRGSTNDGYVSKYRTEPKEKANTCVLAFFVTQLEILPAN
jgi:hypothetical protein